MKEKTPETAGSCLDDIDDLVSELGHGGERDVLARIRLAENKAGILLGEKAFGMMT